MSSSRNNPRNSRFGGAIVVAAILAAAAFQARSLSALAAEKKKGIDVEIPYEATVLKTSLVSPLYVNEASGGMVVSDGAGGVYTVTLSGKSTELVGRSKLKHPAGVAVASSGFGTAGQVYVLSSGDDPGGSCEVDAIDKSGSVSTFAKLPDTGGGKPTDCRDLQFGAKGTPYAGKLYAAVSGNSTIYAIDAAGKAAVFGSYDKPNAWDLTTIGFATGNDSKAPNMMLVGMRLRMGGAAKLGRIGVIGPDGKLKDDPYLVGFIRPTGFGTSPANWGSYGDTFFIVDYGKPSTDEGGASDGAIYRVYKDVPRSYASNLADPTCMKFIGGKMVIADPSIRGKAGEGAIVIISSLL